MITPAGYVCNKEKIEKLCTLLDNLDFPLCLNEPSGNFFYDPWIIKEEFKNTIFNEVLSTLETTTGQARILKLEAGRCYNVHADIDDRYHLNLSGEVSYLVDVDNEQMFRMYTDGIWYQMNAGKRHSAINFGRGYRYQLVVRHVLHNPVLNDPVNVKIISHEPTTDDTRYVFDNYISSWLNESCKQQKIMNFEPNVNEVKFSTERNHIDSLKKILPETLEMILYDQ